MYYIDSPTFDTATAVFTDANLTVKATDGFYKFGTAYREQLGGILLNSIQCTTCIDCKKLASFVYKGNHTNAIVTYIDCQGYTQTLNIGTLTVTGINHFETYTIDGDLCVKNGSATSNFGNVTFNYETSSSCNISTGLIQSTLCGPGSETPTGCSIDCSALEASFYVYINNTTAGYLQNGNIVYDSNDTSSTIDGGDLYYKIKYETITYGVKISNLGVISELTYCNP